jgi:putative transcriptional regulator
MATKLKEPKKKLKEPEQRKAPPRTNKAGRELLDAAREVLSALQTGDTSQLTIRTVEIPDPGEYGPAAVKSLRETLGVSQGIFALLIGVSPDLVAHWEHGIRKPGPLARRLMDMVAENPSGYLAKLVRRRVVSEPATG